MEAWNVKQLKDALIKSLASCTSPHEVTMCKAIGGKEIREKAIQWSAERRLTPSEVAIAKEFGYKGN